ncbi:hypothetical protein F0L74_05255 [Chitinophaga agrisoli]|uniref:3-keto-disaccharide hydrolase domain-containing protein n=1 Tax=Chitinophaga agrisoli TaxID=2607653 RepID=A0A5B2W146_9BACT|nr:hypothetical protein [Chitinophaga agrisoli]KAA2245371.1 hypothetical protein F0L74_05255 [Chitinophaga agrisoli]
MGKKALLYLFAICLPAAVMAQTKKGEITVPLTSQHWDFKPGAAVFEDYKGKPALRIMDYKGPVVSKDLKFANGTIEFDVAPIDSFFANMYFRYVDTLESECFYMRVRGGSSPGAIYAIQYTPIIKGVNLWDMLPQFQGPATYKKDEWNHIKLVINGRQMRAYINDMRNPVMEIPRLEGNTTSGTIAFDGKQAIANLVLKPNETAGVSPEEGADPTAFDPRYIRHWAKSAPVLLPFGQELYERNLPKDISWDNITAERRGLVNLTRLYGENRFHRSAIWLKVKLHVATDQKHRMDLGFSDEVWVFLNRRLAYVDKNLFGSPGMKEPEGRCAVNNCSFTLPLKAGDNELLIGVSNDFYGWGIIARLDDIEGVTVIP